MTLKNVYNITGLISAFLVIVGDIWVSMNIESMKYAFLMFLVANVTSIVHFFIVRSLVILMMPLITLLPNAIGVYNYFNDDLYLASVSFAISVTISGLLVAYIHKKQIKLEVRGNTEKASSNKYYEYFYTFSTIIGMLLISFNEQYASFSGFAIWLIFTPVGFVLAKNIESKGLMLQVIAYIPISIMGVVNYSSRPYEHISVIIATLVFSFIVHKLEERKGGQNGRIKEEN